MFSPIITHDVRRVRLPLDELLLWLLVVALVVAYLPSLGGGFLNYDDPWLIQNRRTP